MRVLLLIGNQPNQQALAAKVAKEFSIAGIVVQQKKGAKKKKGLATLLQKAMERILFFSIHQSWNTMMKHYRQHFPHLPVVPILETNKINAPEVVDFIRQKAPDVVMVSGTTMIKEAILQLKPAIGILNLHTGFSPYVKGGPNCTNWCLSTGEPHLIGNTIMWIDAGIDSGNIITSELTSFSGEESLNEIHLKVMEHAHELYLDVLRACRENKPIPNVPQQQIAEGRTYYTKEWDFSAKWKLIRYMSGRTFRKAVQSASWKRKREELKEVKLEQKGL